jgi:alkylated DNA repair dioxygenase AlkB
MDSLFPIPDQFELLPFDGSTTYSTAFCPAALADELFRRLLQDAAWQNDVVKIYGKTYVTKRKVAWYGDEGFSYKYSGVAKTALPWTETLLRIKRDTELACEEQFNSCLLNLYHDGSEGMSWHSDDEDTLDALAPIASVSLGAARRFSLRHRKTRETVNILLEHGSLLVMDGMSQRHWQHALPKTTKVNAPRINLTFRRMKG